jgi:hypothetical protein
MHNQGIVTERIYQSLRPQMGSLQQSLSQRLAQIETTDKSAERELQSRLMKRMTAVKKARLAMMLREGLLSEDSHRELNEILDKEFQVMQRESTSGPALRGCSEEINKST